MTAEPVPSTCCSGTGFRPDPATALSAAALQRHLRHRPQGDGSKKPDALEFGVSGALFNSNVLMYDRTDKALWSQLGMEAVSGPLSGTRLRHLPVRVVSFQQFKEA